MLSLNLKRIAGLRGIDKAYSFLLKNGFVHSTATKLSSQKLSNIKISQIGKLCVLLNCTPNDLFEWTDSTKNPLGETHALRSLIRDSSRPRNINDLFRDIPAEKLNEIENLLKDLKNK